MKTAVVGSGAWGTALAIRLCKNGHDVTMWTFEKELIPEMEATRRNPRLPSAILPENLKISGDYSCVRGCELVVMASPSFPARAVGKGVAPYIDQNAVVVSDISPDKAGRAKVAGLTWQAKSSEVIKKGEMCTIVKIEGVSLVVSKVTVNS